MSHVTLLLDFPSQNWLFRPKSAKLCQNYFTSLLLPLAMLIFRRVLWCAKNVEKISLCCFVPFRRQRRGHYLKARNKLIKYEVRIWKFANNLWKTYVWSWKSETAKETRKTQFFACLAEMSKTFIFLHFLLWGVRFLTVANYYISYNLIQAIQGKPTSVLKINLMVKHKW